MELGAFSVSLSVKDLAASRRFYEARGFTPSHGDADKGWLVLRNGDVVEADESTTGPASFFVVDRDGNRLLFDQYV